MKLYTIGFTQKSAERFFGLLAGRGVERVVDIRLNPGGQLSGFAKQDDLAWFLDRLNGAGYIHLPQLAPSPEIRDAYRKDHDWERYVLQFEALMDERGIPDISTGHPSRRALVVWSAASRLPNGATAASSPSVWPVPGQAVR